MVLSFFFNSRILQTGILQPGPNQFVENQKQNKDNTGDVPAWKICWNVSSLFCRNVFAETSCSRWKLRELKNILPRKRFQNKYIEFIRFDNNTSISDIIQSSKVYKDQCQWLNHVGPKCCLLKVNGFVKINGTLTIQKICSLLDYLTLHTSQWVFLTETWLDSFDNRVLSLFGQYEVVFRNDRINGSHGGVTILLEYGANLSVEPLPQPSTYDICARVMVHVPDNGISLSILFYLPPDRRCYENDPSTLNSCLSYCILKSQLINASETYLYIGWF